MMLKHKYLALGIALAAASPIAFAQDNPPPATPPSDSSQGEAPAPKPRGRMSPQAMVDMMKDKLSLTDDQAAKILDILKNAQAEGKKIRQDDSLSDDDKKAKAMELRKSSHDQVRAVLTADQQAIFDKMPPPGARKPKSEGDAPPPAPPPAN